eukprot:COSAG02_NODE_2801_length_8003_cov_5.731655_4_plen_342_part_00
MGGFAGAASRRRLPMLLVHGGAWAIPQRSTVPTLAGIRAASLRGWKSLMEEHGTAVDAVEAAVRVLEDDSVFDAGRGSVLTEEGRVEMDAVIMDGRTLDTGAVACLTAARNPVSVARAVMEQTEHCLVVGAGADGLAARLGCEAASQSWLTTPAAKEEYEHFQSYTGVVHGNFSEGMRNRESRAGLGHDTVGAVAVDRDGNVAAATSTGGITFGMPGRVGDSPLVGLGCLADNELGAISATGHGESIMRMCLGSRILLSSERGSTLSDAARNELEAMRTRVNGHGGVIAIKSDGNWVVDFTTERMAWGVVTGDPRIGSGSRTEAVDGGYMLVGIDEPPPQR